MRKWSTGIKQSDKRAMAPWTFVLLCLCCGVYTASLPTVPVYVTTTLFDVRTISDQEAFFEAAVEWKFEWETRFVDGQLWWPKLQSNNMVAQKISSEQNLFNFGETSTLIMRQRSEWAFQFHFRSFPFDKQELHIELCPVVSDKEIVVLLPVHTSSDDLLRNVNDFHVEGWNNFHSARTKTTAAESIIGTPLYGYTFSFYVEREYGSYLVQNIFPAAIFVCIAFAGFWMDFSSLMPRLMPILFATVALANLNSSTSSFITRGGTISFFESFALYSTIISALVLVELVVVHNLARRKYREAALVVDKICRFAFPSLYVIFTLFLVLCLVIEIPLYGSLLFLFGGLFILTCVIMIYLALRAGYYKFYKSKPGKEET